MYGKLIDLLIERWRKQEDTDRFEPVPLHIRDEYDISQEDLPQEEEKDGGNVIIIDL